MFSVSGPKIGVRCSSVVRVFAHKGDGSLEHWLEQDIAQWVKLVGCSIWRWLSIEPVKTSPVLVLVPRCKLRTYNFMADILTCSVVRAFAHGAMGHQIDPSWWTHWDISHSIQCSTTGVTKAVVCVIMSVGQCI